MIKSDPEDPETQQTQQQQPPPEYQSPPQPSSQEQQPSQPSQYQHQQQISPSLHPPPYKTATPIPTTQTFTRRHPFTSKLQVESQGVARYTFTPRNSPKPAVWLHAGASSSTRALGYLTFPASHNAFRLYFGGREEGEGEGSFDPVGERGDSGGLGRGGSQVRSEGVDDQGFHLSDVKARVGVPHVSKFSFKSSPGVSPSSSTRPRREFEWTNKTPPSSPSSVPVRYVLSVSTPAGWEELALLVVPSSRTGKGKDGTTLTWSQAPESELEQAFLVLSAIGVVTRLSKKGMFRDGQDGIGGQRWFAFWWMAALGSAAVV